MKPSFDHEKLLVYQKSISFTAWADDFLHALTQKPAVKDQLDRASTSIPLNIAEGSGKFSVKDRCRYYEIARGSAVECAACLDVCVAKKLIDPSEIIPGKEQLREIVSMLIGLMASLTNQVREENVEYCIDEGWERV